MAIVEFSVDNTVCGPPQKKKTSQWLKKKNSVWWNSHVLSWWNWYGQMVNTTPGRPLAPTVTQGDARYARPIYSLSYRSIVWSLLCYCLRARDHCCVLCDVTRDLLFTWYICTSREPTGLSTEMVKNERSTQGLLLLIRYTRSFIGLSTTAWENNPENQTWWVKI